MPAENYKKWTIIGIVVLIAIVVVFAVITSEKSSQKNIQRTPPPGLVTEQGTAPPQQLQNLPEDPAELSRLGDQYFESSRFELAIQVYEKVLEKNPNDIDTYNDLGLALFYVRKPDAAIDVLRKGTQVMPSYQRIWLSMGFIFSSMGKNEEAKTALKTALDLNPNNDVGQEARKMLDSFK